jgi:hypothetical protein
MTILLCVEFYSNTLKCQVYPRAGMIIVGTVYSGPLRKRGRESKIDRHSRESGNPYQLITIVVLASARTGFLFWIPAFAGMTGGQFILDSKPSRG